MTIGHNTTQHSHTNWFSAIISTLGLNVRLTKELIFSDGGMKPVRKLCAARLSGVKVVVKKYNKGLMEYLEISCCPRKI